MFTGIIEEIGSVKTIEESGEAIIMTVEAPHILEDAALGDSISVNGVCLTVNQLVAPLFTVDLMPETFRSTSLRYCHVGSKVNLERAMAANGRFGGHFVSGHVDGIGTVIKKERRDNAIYYDIEVSDDLSRYMVYKGSVTIDGISLTIFGLNSHTVTLSIIPHTTSHTILGDKGIGDIVNIETDMVGKYLEKFMRSSQQVGADDPLL